METTFNPLPSAVDTAKLTTQVPEFTPEFSKLRYCRSGFCMSVMTDPRSTYCDDCLLQTCKKRSSFPNQLQVLHWTFSEGEYDKTITVIMEQTASGTPRGPLKIAFGQLQVDTFYCAHLIPPSNNGCKNINGSTVPHPTDHSKMYATTLITLTAKVPDVRKIQLGYQGQVSIYVYCYDYYKCDEVTGLWTVGDVFYHDGLFLQKARGQTLPPSKPIEQSQKKTANTIPCLEEFSVEQLLESFDGASPELALRNALYLQNLEIGASIKQQIPPSLLKDREYQQLWDSGNLRNGSSRDNATTGLDNNLVKQQVRHFDASGLIDWLNIPGFSSDFNIPHDNYSMASTRSNSGNSNKTSSHIGMDDANSYTFDSSLTHHSSASHEQNDSTCMQPFRGILNKANLDICGDLMGMTFKWSANERHSGRRLVRFWRSQNADMVENNQQVECRFEPIEFYYQQHQQTQKSQDHIHMRSTLPAHDTPTLNSPMCLYDDPARLWDSVFALSTTADNRKLPSSSHVVSCIYWKERNDYFITSVDCIYLLEGLIGVQFTVEEKNRIRRNLEGFRPLTVSKCRDDSADFFKLIMDFPHPKPRNIEKDVKVFAWRLLPHALKKIIRKYTPNYNKLRKTRSFLSFSGMPSPQISPTSSSVCHHKHCLDIPSPYQLPRQRHSY